MGKRQLIGGFSIVDFRCRPYAVGSVAEENFVEVEFKNLILVQLLLNFQGQEGFFDFTCPCFFRCQEEIPGELLGDGASTDCFLAGGRQRPDSPRDALVVNSGMFVKTRIFSGKECLFQVIRCFFNRDGDPSFFTENPQQFAVLTENPERNLELYITQSLDIRKVRLKHQVSYADS